MVAAEKARIARGPRKVEERHIYTQRELLEDALETELVNQIWLDRQKIGHDDVNVADKNGGARTGPAGYIRKISKRGAYDTITFSTMDVMPKVLMLGASSDRNGKTKSKCVITGRIAKYRDPLTNKSYATLAAFKEIRRMAANRTQIGHAPVSQAAISSSSGLPLPPPPVTKATAPTTVVPITNGSIRINADGSISIGNVNSISVPPAAPVSKMPPPTISTLPSATANETANKTAMDVA